MSKPHRPKGTGSVRNRGTDRSPRWFAYYFVTAGGKRRQRSEGPFNRKSDAEAWLREEIRRLKEGREISSDRITVAELLDAWLAAATPRLERNTVSEYRRQVEHRLKPHLGELFLADLRPKDILGMLDELRKPGADRRSKRPRGLSETTLQHTLQCLRTALDWGVRHRLLAYNQAKDVDRPKREQKEMVVWTADELSRFMGSISGKRFYPLLRLAAFTGMRRSELLGLLWRDVDLDAAVVRVRRVRLKDGYVMFEEERTKSRRGRRAIDVDAVTVGAFRRWADDQAEERRAWGIAYVDSGAAFTAEDGSPFHADRVAQAFDRLVAAAPVPDIRFHDLRHTHASLLLAQGVPVVDVAYRLGDSPETILSTYAHFIPGQGQQTASAFSDLIDGHSHRRNVARLLPEGTS